MADELTSFHGARYKVLRKLGEGGKGIVFLCQDTILNRNVAVKVIKGDVLDPEGLLRYQREVQAMGRLIHPNVVTVFDIGEEDGRHFVVLELMEGGDAEHLIEASPARRLDTATTVSLGQDIAKALEHAHKHGILHRDVKPANIWLTKEGVAKLGDFGLAYLGGSLKITQAGMMVGSVAYMAPELALGRQADARSDLYMLGAALYEMVTGRVPFPGDDPVKVIFSHINDIPLPPRRFAPDLSLGLESLILRLLSKDPEQRPSSAAQLLEGLEETARDAHPVAAQSSNPAGAQDSTVRPPSPEPRFAQPLVGREQELTLLRQRVDAAVRGEGSVTFITGEAGIGKTRLAWEVRPYVRGRGCLWLEGRYLKEGRVLFQPWIEAIRSFLRSAPPALLVKVLMPYGAELAKLVPEVAERLGRLPPTASIGPEEDRSRLFNALVGFFTGIAREQPLVIFVDDLQWATSLDTLPHLARRIASERLMIVAAYRDVELKEKPPLSKALLAMNRDRLFHSLPLKRLGESEVTQMVAQTLGESASKALADVVNQKTEGNPFFVEELVRYLAESGGITLGEKGWEVKDPALVQLPDSVKAVVEERLEQLGEETSAVLTWASVVGREFTLALLQELAGIDEDDLLDIVDKAVAARILTPRLSLGREAYTFVDQQTRDVLYEKIGPARRRRYHLKVGQGMEKIHGRRLDEYYDALADHFLQGGNLQKAAEYAAKAGDKASTIYTWGRAALHYQTALELLEELEVEPAQQAGLLQKLARVTSLGKSKGALGYYERALSRYEDLGDRKKAGAVHLRLAEQYHFHELEAQDIEKASVHGQKAVSLLEEEGESPELAQAYARLGFIVAHSGREPKSVAIELAEKGLAVAGRLGDPGTVAVAELVLGQVLSMTAEIKRSLELERKSCERGRENGDLTILARGANALAQHYIILADGDSALQWAEQAAVAAKQAGTIRYQIHAAGLEACARTIKGDVARALSSLKRAQQLATSAGIVGVGSYADRSVPIIDFFRGDWEKAETALKFITVTDPRKQTTSDLISISHLAQLYVVQGNFTGTKTLLSEATNAAEANGTKTHAMVPRLLLAEATAKKGELDEAVEQLRRAQEILSNGEDWRGLAAQVHLAEGIVATAGKKWQEAEEALTKAQEVHGHYPFPYYEAKCLFERGQMYLSRNESGDRERGMQLLDAALTIFQRIQAKKMVEKVLGRKQVLTA